MKSSNKAVRQSVTLPAKTEGVNRKQREFFELAERFRDASDPAEARRLGDKLGRVLFREQKGRLFHMKRHTAVMIVLVVSMFALATKVPADLTPADSRKVLPGIALTDDKGAPVDLSAYKGRVVLLDFWATWCEGCKEEIPWFMEFQDRYNKTGLTVVGASLDDDGWKSVRPYLQEHKINYRIVIGTFESAKQFGVDKGMPVSVLIDRNGKIADLHPGMVDKDALEREIQTLLKEPAKSNP